VLNGCAYGACYLQDQSWEWQPTPGSYATNITITEFRASTVYSLANNSILDLQLALPSTTNYTANDFFPVFDMALSYNNSDRCAENSTQAQFLSAITGLIGSNYVANESPPLLSTAVSPKAGPNILRQLMAIPVAIFNTNYLGGASVANTVQGTGALSFPTYRVNT